MPKAPSWFPWWRFASVRISIWIVAIVIVYVLLCYIARALLGANLAMIVLSQTIEYAFYGILAYALFAIVRSLIRNHKKASKTLGGKQEIDDQ